MCNINIRLGKHYSSERQTQKKQTDKQIKLNHCVGQPLASRFRLVFFGEVFRICHQLSACASLELTAALWPASEKIQKQRQMTICKTMQGSQMIGLDQSCDASGPMLIQFTTLDFCSICKNLGGSSRNHWCSSSVYIFN